MVPLVRRNWDGVVAAVATGGAMGWDQPATFVLIGVLISTLAVLRPIRPEIARQIGAAGALITAMACYRLFVDLNIPPELGGDVSRLESLHWVTLLTPLVGSFGGALAGAYAGSVLAQYRQELAESRKRAGAGRRALFVLLEQRTILINLEQQHLVQLRQKGSEAWAVKAARGIVRRPALDIDSLSFLLEGPHADLLNVLTVGESRFSEMMSILTDRAEFNEKFQEIVGRVPNAATTQFTTTQLEQLAGPKLLQTLRDLTLELLLAADEIEISNEKNKEALLGALRQMFPKEIFKGFHRI